MVTAGTRTPTDWSLFRNGAVIGARVGDRGEEKQSCQNRAVIGARVGDRGDATLPPR